MASSTQASSDAARPDIAELRFLLQAHGRAAMFLNEKPPSILHCRWREIVMMTRRQFNATASAALLVPSVVATHWGTRRGVAYPGCAHRALCSGRADRCDWTHRRRAALEALGPTGRHREPTGRRYKHRERDSRALGA